jgi:predicted TIM-barrel fold metal-dependent hydrolase
MHLHAEEEDLPFAICIPWSTQLPAWNQKQKWQDVFYEAMTNPTCSDPIWAPSGDDLLMKQTIAIMERRNMIGVLSGRPNEVLRWSAAAPGRFLPSIQFKIGRDDISPQKMRDLFESGKFAALGEISNQYAGIAPDDERMEVYWALAEELDIPVQIHMGEGTVGTAYIGFAGMSAYRARLSNPYLLEEIFVRHPRLRVSVMHYAAPLIDEMIAVLGSHPQVYVETGGMQWYYPRVYFYEQLRKLMDAGFGKRVMFGSDQGNWPGVIEPSIEIIEEAPFLAEGQKRDIFYNNAARFLRLSDEDIAAHHKM